MGIISRRRLILSYTIQEVIPNVCTTFQNPRFSSSWEIFDEKKKFTHTHTNIVTEKTKTIYPLYTSYRGGGIIILSWAKQVGGAQAEDLCVKVSSIWAAA